MPGPNSQPRARTSRGDMVTGKTALRRAGLTSGQNLTARDVEAHHTEVIGRDLARAVNGLIADAVTDLVRRVTR